MAPKKGHYKRFNLSAYQAAKKKAQSELVEKTLQCSKELQSKSRKLKRLQTKVL